MVEIINNYIWGGVLLILMIVVGVYLTVKTGFFQFTHFIHMIKETMGSIFNKRKSKNTISPFSAMSAALSGTMGTGNIAGVGAAIMLGGAGALFWMWISAFLCMIIKFSEVALAVQFREKNARGEWCGGPMYYIKNGLPKLFPLSLIFSCATIIASFGIGNAAQINAMSSSLFNEFAFPTVLTGSITAILACFVIFGGVKRLTDFTSKLVPFMTLFYLLGTITVIIVNRQRILPAAGEIFNDAFNLPSATGGVFGFALSSSLRYGVSRGVFTNEAGMGSAPIVHAAADNTPLKQGYWGIFEVFVDTIIMCSLTGFVILTSNVFSNSCMSTGLNLTAAAFSEVFGKFGSIFVTISIVLFAFGAIVGWSYYGSKCCEFLFKKRIAVSIYKVIFCAVIIIGAVTSTNIIFEISDMLNGLMALPNLIALIILTPEVLNIINTKH